MISTLSKSRFLAGLQCPLRLWSRIHQPGLAKAASPVRLALLETGHEVGRLARLQYPEGISIPTGLGLTRSAVEATRSGMGQTRAEALFEAAFLEEGVFVRVDVLERSGSGWKIVEVKSGTSVKEEHLWDVAVQHRVLDLAGLDVSRVLIRHVNPDYVFDGERLDLDRFFTMGDVTRQARERSPDVKEHLEDLKRMLEQGVAPVVAPSRHCHGPHTCEFWDHCTAGMPDHWVFQLPRIGRDPHRELEEMGIRDIRDIPEGFPLNPLQQRVRQCVIDGREYVGPELAAQLLEVEHPVHFLDFEAVNPAIPMLPGTRPYEVVPFQWSDHAIGTDGSLCQKAFLADGPGDPREAFVETLLEAVGKTGTIFTYTTYERTLLDALGRRFPEHREALGAVTARLRDLCAVIRRGFYAPAFHGSFSIKAVLPALVPGMGYGGLAVQDGLQAGIAFLKLARGEMSAEAREGIRANLLAYCRQDTLAMVRVREALIGRIA